MESDGQTKISAKDNMYIKSKVNVDVAKEQRVREKKSPSLSDNLHDGYLLNVVVQQSKQYGQKCKDKIRVGANHCRTEELPH